jgi:HlyD family secretion protein
MKKKTNPKKKKAIILSIVAVLVIATVGTAFAVASGSKNNETGTTFKTVTATRGDVSLNVSASGNIEGASATIISSNVNALINSTEVSVGDYINEGDILFGLDVAYLEDELEDAEDELESYNEDLSEDYESNDDLYVTAPVDGIISAVNAEIGENASAVGQAYGSVMQIATENKMEATLHWAKYYAPEEGETVSVGVYGYEGTIEATISEVSGYDFTVEVADATYPQDVYIDVRKLDDDTYIGWGELNVADDNLYTITGNSDIVAIYVSEGQWVTRGQNLFKYENSSLSNQISDQKDTIAEQEETIAEIKALIESPYIKSTVSGIVSKSYVDVDDGGATISEDDSLLEVVDGNALQVTVSVDELDVVTLEVGMAADVTIDAFPDSIYEGELTSISRIGEPSGDITYYDAVVKLIDPGDDILVGMSASTEIKVESVEDVVIVPVSALQYRNGGYYVYVPADDVPTVASVDNGTQVLSAEPNAENAENMTDEDRAAMREKMSGETSTSIAVDESEAVLVPVEVGLMDEFYVEILSGISEGQVILIPEIAEDEDESATTMMPGMMGGGTGERPEGGQKPQ